MKKARGPNLKYINLGTLHDDPNIAMTHYSKESANNAALASGFYLNTTNDINEKQKKVGYKCLYNCEGYKNKEVACPKKL